MNFTDGKMAARKRAYRGPNGNKFFKERYLDKVVLNDIVTKADEIRNFVRCTLYYVHVFKKNFF